MVPAPRQRGDPLPTGPAMNRPANESPGVVRFPVMPKIIAIAVVIICEIDAFGRGEPASVLIIDEQAVDAAETGFTDIQEFLKSRDPVGIRRTGFQLADDANEICFGEFEAVVGVLRQRARELAKIHLCISEFDAARRPLRPAARRDDGDTNQRNECRCQKWQARQTKFVSGCVHPAGVSERRKIPRTS
jgi:hypothetical protein